MNTTLKAFAMIITVCTTKAALAGGGTHEPIAMKTAFTCQAKSISGSNLTISELTVATPVSGCSEGAVTCDKVTVQLSDGVESGYAVASTPNLDNVLLPESSEVEYIATLSGNSQIPGFGQEAVRLQLEIRKSSAAVGEFTVNGKVITLATVLNVSETLVCQ